LLARISVGLQLCREIDIGLYFFGCNRSPVCPLGEGAKEFFKVCLFDVTGSVKCSVTLRWPLAGDGLDPEAVYAKGRAEIAFSKQRLRGGLLKPFLFPVNLLILLGIPLFEQDVEGVVFEMWTIFPPNPGAPWIVDPSLERECPLLAITGQSPVLDSMVSCSAFMFEALQIESDFEGFIEVRSSLVNQLPFLDGPVSPRTLLRIVGGDLNADPIVCRSVNSTVIFVRSDPVLAIPALKHLVIGIALRALILAEAIAQQ
jgi:hypothetical protein